MPLRGVRNGALAILLALVGVGGVAGGAQAHDHVPPPPPVLLTSMGRQSGHLVESQWATRIGRDCAVGFGDGRYEYPEAIAVGPLPQIRIRVAKRQRPDHVLIRATHAVNPSSSRRSVSNALSENYPVRLQPVRRKGRMEAWDLAFSPTVVGDLYLDVHVSWNDREGCRSEETIYYTFHIASP